MSEYIRTTKSSATTKAAQAAARPAPLPAADPRRQDIGLSQVRDTLNHSARVETLAQLQRKLNQPRFPTVVIQRFPTRATIVARLGEPKHSIRVGHGSKKYRRVLAAVEAYEKYLSSTTVDRGSVADHFRMVGNLLQNIDDAAAQYEAQTPARAAASGKHKSRIKAEYMLHTLRPEVAAERGLASRTAFMVLTGRVRDRQTVASAMLAALSSTKPLPLSRANERGGDRGGMSEVTRFGMEGGREGFFKANKATLTDLTADGAEDAMEAKLRSELPADEAADRFNALQVESNLGVQTVGISADDAHMANRDVAMWRLDQLLEAGVIARAQLAVRTVPDQAGVFGAIMEGAEGRQAAALMGTEALVPDATEAAKQQGRVNQRDPNLMRLLSKLQLIDLLAYQVDRNPKNFFIQTDPGGKVTGITGIDNDLSLGTKTDFGDNMQELPGVSRYVDKELALKILSLDLRLVEIVFADLLSPTEIAALIGRFKVVQTHLRSGQANFLEPQEWTDAVARGLTDEKKSYWADLEHNKKKYGPKKQRAHAAPAAGAAAAGTSAPTTAAAAAAAAVSPDHR